MIKLYTITILILLISCDSSIHNNYDLQIIIPSSINIDKNILKKTKSSNNKKKIYLVKVYIYNFSKGKEIFSINDSGIAFKNNPKYKIEGLIKIIKNTKTINSFVVKGSGNSETQAIDIFIGKLEKELN